MKRTKTQIRAWAAGAACAVAVCLAAPTAALAQSHAYKPTPQRSHFYGPGPILLPCPYFPRPGGPCFPV